MVFNETSLYKSNAELSCILASGWMCVEIGSHLSMICHQLSTLYSSTPVDDFRRRSSTNRRQRGVHERSDFVRRTFPFPRQSSRRGHPRNLLLRFIFGGDHAPRRLSRKRKSSSSNEIAPTFVYNLRPYKNKKTWNPNISQVDNEQNEQTFKNSCRSQKQGTVHEQTIIDS